MRRGRQPIDTTVPSPCIALCKVDKTDQTCTGCLRTLDEIKTDILAVEKESEGLLTAILGTEK